MNVAQASFAQGRPQAFNHWRMNPLSLMGKIADWYNGTQWIYMYACMCVCVCVYIIFFSLCANSIGTSKKLGKPNNQHKAEISSNKPQSKHQIFTWKPFNEKGKTTGPSPVKNFHYWIKSLQQFSLKLMLKTTKTLKNTIKDYKKFTSH